MTNGHSGVQPRAIIVGGGFAGLHAVKALKNAPVEVLLIDQNNYHTFQPLLYQVATAGLDAGEIAHQLRGVFHQKNFYFRQGTVRHVRLADKVVVLANEDELPYDYLILAAGAVYNDFGIPGVREHSFFLKSLTEAVNIRSHVLRQFERVSADPSLVEEGALNFVLVGGGPTGVEMAGALSELLGQVLPKDYPHLDFKQVKIILLEMTDSLLNTYHRKSRRYAERVLKHRGVDVRLGEAVSAVGPGHVELKNGEVISTQTLIWAAGVRASPLADELGLKLTGGYRVEVNRDLSVPEHPEIFVVGDMAGASDGQGNLYPQVAPVAIQQGKHAGHQVARLAQGQQSEPFHYFDKGSMAIIGRNAGVAELSKAFLGLRFRGFPGWLSWLGIHLIYLVGYQNKFITLSNWAYNYLTFDRHARLITDFAPSPAEVAGRTGKLVSQEHLRERYTEAEPVDV